jgi:hypothetical protein
VNNAARALRDLSPAIEPEYLEDDPLELHATPRDAPFLFNQALEPDERAAVAEVGPSIDCDLPSLHGSADRMLEWPGDVVLAPEEETGMKTVAQATGESLPKRRGGIELT